MYWALHRKYNLHLHAPSGWTARLLFQRALGGLFGWSARITGAVENGRLQRSVAALLASVVVVAAAPLLADGIVPGPRPLLPVAPLAAVAWLALAAGALGAVVWHRERLVAVIAAGVVGLVVSLGFLYFSAPDLALTQLSVEVVSTVLLLMALAVLPPTTPRESSPARRRRDAALAGLAGAGVALIAFAAMTRDPDTMSWYFVEHSVPRGGGANMVNVILVDFRGFDTYGEITVLAIAALGVAALMAGVRARRPGADPAGRPWAAQVYPPLFAVAARWLLPFAVLVSAYIFFRGHNAPGGGFIAGLVTAVALVMQYMAHGFAPTARRVGGGYARLAAAGLLVAGLTGIGAWFFGAPFLTSAHGHPVLPLVGEVPLASAVLFDLGVYLTVVGGTLAAIAALVRATGERAGEGT
jgi:multicomponent K+:H+ antiporter subunit A